MCVSLCMDLYGYRCCSTCTYVGVCVYLCISVRVCIYVCIFVCMFVCLYISSSQVGAVGELRHDHAAAPGLQVSLGGHLAAGGVLVHLAHPLHLPATPQAHVRRRLQLQALIQRHWGRGGERERETQILGTVFAKKKKHF